MKTEGTNHFIQFGERRIPYRLHWADRKQLRITVSPDLAVEVYAPKSVDNMQVQKTVMKKAPWIAKTLDKLESYHPLPVPKKYISGETFIYLGRQYRLKVRKGKKQPAKLQGRFLWIQVKDGTGGESVKRVVEAWYRRQAEQAFQRYTQRCYEIASRHGVPEPSMTIRTMKRRWGSCSQAGRITLNVSLVLAPVHCIEYVIMHELCHLKVRNHGRRFYSLLTRCMPDWRRRKEILDRITLV